ATPTSINAKRMKSTGIEPIAGGSGSWPTTAALTRSGVSAAISRAGTTVWRAVGEDGIGSSRVSGGSARKQRGSFLRRQRPGRRPRRSAARLFGDADCNRVDGIRPIGVGPVVGSQQARSLLFVATRGNAASRNSGHAGPEDRLRPASRLFGAATTASTDNGPHSLDQPPRSRTRP